MWDVKYLLNLKIHFPQCFTSASIGKISWLAGVMQLVWPEGMECSVPQREEKEQPSQSQLSEKS